MLILTFLKLQGYSIDEDVLKEHIVNSLAYYAGDGWYRDGQLFDYYSPWPFQVYGPIWNKWYGYKYEPELAEIIERNSNKLMRNEDELQKITEYVINNATKWQDDKYFV